jgi:hypothetical protein
MGTEMKSPENCENTVRNRKKKENVQDKSVKSSPKSTEDESVKEVDHKKIPQEENLKIKQQNESNMKTQISNESLGAERNFRIRLEFDPMSIALFTLAIVTRFFRLSEPRNVV